MTLQKYVCSLSIFLFAGCSPLPQPVGGPCEYDQFICVARIKQMNGNFRATCSSEALIAEGLNHIELPIQPTWPSARVTYPALFKKITSGSCTPYSITLLGSHHGFSKDSKGIFIELDPDGNILEPARATLHQIGETFTTLQDEALKLHLCGQTRHAGTDEYNLNLSYRHTTLVAKLLQEEGVSTEQMTMTSMGEYGCAPTCSTLNANTNGVCVSFR